MAIKIYSGQGRETGAGNKSRRTPVFLLEAQQDTRTFLFAFLATFCAILPLLL
jgi:hypothetical protein